MTRYMKRRNSPHVFVYDKNLENNPQIEILPEGFDINGYSKEMLRTKDKPEFSVEYFFPERVAEILNEQESVKIVRENNGNSNESPRRAIPLLDEMILTWDNNVGIDAIEDGVVVLESNDTDNDDGNETENIEVAEILNKQEIEHAIDENVDIENTDESKSIGGWNQSYKSLFTYEKDELKKHIESQFGVIVKNDMRRDELLELFGVLNKVNNGKITYDIR